MHILSYILQGLSVHTSKIVKSTTERIIIKENDLLYFGCIVFSIGDLIFFFSVRITVLLVYTFCHLHDLLLTIFYLKLDQILQLLCHADCR